MSRVRMPFSVLLSVYHGDVPDFFREALESIFNQTLLPDELVLVVDGKVPHETREIIKSFEDSHKIKTIWLKENMGHGYARRVGLDKCKYEFISNFHF